MRKESLAPVVAALSVLVALAALLVWLWARGSSGELAAPVPAPAAPETPGVSPQAPPGPSSGGAKQSLRTVTVWLDGWSYLTAGGPELAVESFQGDLLLSSTASPLALSPVTLQQLEQVARDEPELVTRLAARLARFDALLECDSSGCSSQRGPFPLSWIAQPSQVPSLGEVYTAWGVDHGVYTASLQVPEGADTLVLSTLSGWRSQPIVVAGRDHLPVSAAFGALFELEPNWVTRSGVWGGQPYRLEAVSGAAPSDGLAGVFDDGTAFWRGLAVAVPNAKLMHPSVLTMLSSPAFGCNGALCVPGVANVSFEQVAQVRSRACQSPDFPEPSGLDVSAEALVSATQLEVSVSLTRPIRQVGAALPPASQWPGHVEGGTGPYTGDAPLSFGDLVFSVQQAWLFAGDELVPHIGYFREPAPGTPLLGESSWEDLSVVARRCR